MGGQPVTRTFDRAKLTQLLGEAERDRFWGSLELSYQDGQLVLVRRTETFKIRQENYSHGNPPTNR
jgi:hypothetical protein